MHFQDFSGQEREPQLKYSQLAADAPMILARDEATAFRASGKLHVLGCSSGHVHVLDFEGHRVRIYDMFGPLNVAAKAPFLDDCRSSVHRWSVRLRV
jgi:hypothetical protein